MSALDEIMEEFREAFEKADTQNKQDAVVKSFDQRIQKAFEEHEAELEREIQSQNQILLEEQKQAEQDLKDLEDSVEDKDKGKGKEKEKDSKSLIQKDISDISKKEFKDKYTVKEMISFAKSMGLKGYSKLKEDELIDLIYENN